MQFFIFFNNQQNPFYNFILCEYLKIFIISLVLVVSCHCYDTYCTKEEIDKVLKDMNQGKKLIRIKEEIAFFNRFSSDLKSANEKFQSVLDFIEYLDNLFDRKDLIQTSSISNEGSLKFQNNNEHRQNQAYDLLATALIQIRAVSKIYPGLEKAKHIFNTMGKGVNQFQELASQLNLSESEIHQYFDGQHYIEYCQNKQVQKPKIQESSSSSSSEEDEILDESKQASPQNSPQISTQGSPQGQGQRQGQPNGQPWGQPNVEPQRSSPQGSGDPRGQTQGQPPQGSGDPRVQTQGQPNVQPSGQPNGQGSGDPRRQTQGQPPQGSGDPRGQTQGQPNVQPSGQPNGQGSGDPRRQTQGQPPQGSGDPRGQTQGQPNVQPSGQPNGQRSGDPIRQTQGQPPQGSGDPRGQTQ
ncbi:hypothetical protein pb186bvf_002661 [Paramecium bursaria]